MRLESDRDEKAEDGIVDLAFGLGKTVVDGGNSLRFNPKYPKKILQLSEWSTSSNVYLFISA